ncbi:hypothetical protein GYH30_005591 [Glycine max]|nr:hypothetical protein GYH30_005591 [Glycine max]
MKMVPWLLKHPKINFVRFVRLENGLYQSTSLKRNQAFLMKRNLSVPFRFQLLMVFFKCQGMKNLG